MKLYGTENKRDPSTTVINATGKWEVTVDLRAMGKQLVEREVYYAKEGVVFVHASISHTDMNFGVAEIPNETFTASVKLWDILVNYRITSLENPRMVSHS